jgi:hypothetical protein
MSDVIIKDLGWLRIQTELKRAKNSFTKSGLPENGKVEQTAQSTKDAERAAFKMSDLVTIAAANEFGAPRRKIPERSFMRSTFDETKGTVADLVGKEYDKILKGSSTVLVSLGRLGAYMKGAIQKKIQRGPFVANRPFTIERKGSSRPLIDTGQLRQSIQHLEVINA